MNGVYLVRMNNIGVNQKLSTAIKQLNDHILSRKNSPYLASILGLKPVPDLTRKVTPNEAKSRKECLERFQKLPHYRIVDPTIYNGFVKHLYPIRNSLSMLSTNHRAFREVNHDQLFRSYCSLPRPGIAHMNYNDFEHFMLQMFSYRAFLKPNTLSGTNIFLYDDNFILRQYIDANATRQAHLKTLWQITNDLKEANIPVTQYERQNMIYKTFFSEREDVQQAVKSIARNGLSADKELAKKALSDHHPPNFDLNTYQSVYSSFKEAADAGTLNVLLLTALRHNNMTAYFDIISKFRPENFTRDTYRILLENFSLLGKEKEFEVWISFLLSHHIHLIDIQLLNTIIFSLIKISQPELAKAVVSHLAVKGNVDLEECDQFLKLIKLEDKSKYSLYIAGYDQLPLKPPVNFHPTEQTFLHILKHYCEAGADFEIIKELLSQVQSTHMLPITSQMFKFVFRGFAVHNYNIEDFLYILQMLIETHDLNSGSRDTWILEQIKESHLPQDLSRFLNDVMDVPRAPKFTIEDNNFIKLSNGLVRQIFLALYHTIGRDSKLKDLVSNVENDLNESLRVAKSRHKARLARDELQPVDLHEREELVYLKKTSLLRLLDLILNL